MSIQDAPVQSPTSVSIGKKADSILLSPAASIKVAQLLAEEEDKTMGLRVAVRPGGCSGFSYDMFFDSEIAADDKVTESAGVRVIVDAASAPMLLGATLDYKDALTGGGFSIDNPNATRSCGCGNSFS